MTPRWLGPRFAVLRSAACVQCGVCAEQCAHGVHQTNPKTGALTADAARCVNCQRCVACCPVGALQIAPAANRFGSGPVWGQSALEEVYRQAQTGGVLLSAMGSPRALPVYWDSLVLNASQVTNPSIDPLREPMETAVYLGKRPAAVRRTAAGALDTTLPPHLLAKTPILFSAMSYGAVSYGVHKALALAAQRLGTYYNTGEGGLHESLYEYGQNTIVQVASGRFGVHRAYLEAGAAIEIKIGQGAKPGIGGHLPGAKIQGSVAETRMVPPGVDAISPAPHHDIYSIEDLSQLVYSLKEATGGRKPVMVKVAAVHNIAAIASGIARSGADIIEIDGFAAARAPRPRASATTWAFPSSWRWPRWTPACAKSASATRCRWWCPAASARPQTRQRPLPLGRTPSPSARRRFARWAATCAARATPGCAAGALPRRRRIWPRGWTPRRARSAL